MKKPDVVFTVTVRPVFHVHHCDEYRAQEARGLYGFHAWGACKACKVEARGYEAWGENGHMQVSWKDRAQMAGGLRYMARRQWNTRDRGVMSYRFRMGQPIYYQA